MAIDSMVFNPVEGLRDLTFNPTQPTNETALRDVVQDISDQLRDYINNTLRPALASETDGSSGADQIGATPITGIGDANTDTVQEILEGLKSAIDTVVLGQIPNDSLTDAKLKQTGDNILPRLTALLADYKYQVAGGTATAITLTISETLTNNLPVNFECSANNSGAATTINGKNFYKTGGTDAPTLVDGKYYTAIYNLAGDCFFLKASAVGTAVAGHVLAGDTFSNNFDTDIPGELALTGDLTVADAVLGKTFYKDDALTKLTGTGANAKRYSSGTSILDGTGAANFSGLGFVPSCVIIEVDNSGNQYRKVYNNTFMDNYTYMFASGASCSNTGAWNNIESQGFFTAIDAALTGKQYTYRAWGN